MEFGSRSAACPFSVAAGRHEVEAHRLWQLLMRPLRSEFQDGVDPSSLSRLSGQVDLRDQDVSGHPRGVLAARTDRAFVVLGTGKRSSCQAFDSLFHEDAHAQNLDCLANAWHEMLRTVLENSSGRTASVIDATFGS